MTPITPEALLELGFYYVDYIKDQPMSYDGIYAGIYIYPDAIKSPEISVKFKSRMPVHQSSGVDIKVSVCGSDGYDYNDIFCVELPTVTSMERMRMLVAALSTE